MVTFVYNIINVEQATKLLKEQLILNVNINKEGYNLRNKFEYICSKFINNIILNDLNFHFYSFKKLLYNNLKFHL